MAGLTSFLGKNKFSVISWLVTVVLALGLIAGALASYLLGDSVTQFSTVIGTYLFAMGVGSWLSKFINVIALPRQLK